MRTIHNQNYNSLYYTRSYFASVFRFTSKSVKVELDSELKKFDKISTDASQQEILH